MSTSLPRLLYDSSVDAHGTGATESSHHTSAAMTAQVGLQASDIIVLILFLVMGIMIATIGVLEICRMVRSSPLSDDDEDEWKDVEASMEDEKRYLIGKLFELLRVQCKLSEEDFITPAKDLTPSSPDDATTASGNKKDSTFPAESSMDSEHFQQAASSPDKETEEIVPSNIGSRVMLPPHNAQSFLYKGSMVKNIAARRLAENCCAICLETYSPGDEVVWSENSKCKHLFHKHCMLDYFASLQSTSKPCPTCRQDFCSLFWDE